MKNDNRFEIKPGTGNLEADAWANWFTPFLWVVGLLVVVLIGVALGGN